MRGRGRYPLRLAPPENCCMTSRTSRRPRGGSELTGSNGRLARACSSRFKTLRLFSRVAAWKFLSGLTTFRLRLRFPQTRAGPDLREE